HTAAGLSRPPGELVDRLADHFLRVVPPASVTWVHPSWRDLVIEELAADAEARRGFLRACGIDGLLLALSAGGGVAGEPRPPLPDLAPTWIELLPTPALDVGDAAELDRLDEWLALTVLLDKHAPEILRGFGFPERQTGTLATLLVELTAHAEAGPPSEQREL